MSLPNSTEDRPAVPTDEPPLPKRIPKRRIGIIKTRYCCTCVCPIGILDVACPSCDHRACCSCPMDETETMGLFRDHFLEETPDLSCDVPIQVTPPENLPRTLILVKSICDAPPLPHHTRIHETQLGDKPTKRKLDMIKCRECRSSKKKCAPVTRAWPAKCLRCIEKGLPCSPPRRAPRSERVVADLTPSLPSQASAAVDAENVMESVEKWTFLSGYYKIMIAGKEELLYLKEDMTEPFPGLKTILPQVDRSPYGDFLHLMFDILKPRYEESVKEILATYQSPGPSQLLFLPALIAQGFELGPSGSQCPVCDSSEQHVILDAFQRCQDTCNEFLARQRRIKKHYELCEHLGHQISSAELNNEFERYWVLSSNIQSRMGAFLESLGFSEADTYFCKRIGLYHGEIIGKEFLKSTIGVRDCLGRTSAHRCLDGLSKADHVTIQDLHLFLDCLGTSLDDQDILGRTPLHIACQMNWEAAVQKLLRLGAKPGLTTIYGSLPLHNAVAQGSRAICQRLLDLKELFDISILDGAGMSALNHAKDMGLSEILDLFTPT